MQIGEIILIGAGLGLAMHWVECLIRPSLFARKVSWLVMVRVPEGIVIAAALRMLKVL